MIDLRRIAAAAAALACAAHSPLHAANWNVARVNHVLLTPPGGVTVAEMSGVAYVGPAGGAHRFVAVEENKGELVLFDLTFDASGGITGVANVAAAPIPLTLDFEGIAYTNPARNSVFVSDENGPGVRELSLAGGAQLQAVAVPTVFTASKRANLGFESLTRTLDGGAMWTANEQALTVDGPVSTATTGTLVRLVKFSVAGDAVAAGAQYAYLTAPIHGTSALGDPQSGLSDLVAMPDGTLLALERSVALAAPLYLNRIYEVDLAGATDVSTGPAAGGLQGASFTPVAKDLRWEGAADGGSGQNLEGLALGPRLASGAWTLVGVVDNGEGFSANTLVAFTATANPSADFNDDGAIDGADFLAWQRGAGVVVGAAHAQGDADRDGDVDGADLAIWRTSFATAAPGAAVPEASGLALSLAIVAALAVMRGGRQAVAASRRPGAGSLLKSG